MVLHDRKLINIMRNNAKSVFASVLISIMAMTVLISANSYAAYATDSQLKDNGDLLWSIRVNEKAGNITPPVYDDGFIYAASEKTLYKIDAASGEIKAESSYDESVGYATVPVTVGGDHVFVPLNRSKVAIIDKNDMTSKTVCYAQEESASQTISPITYDSEEDCIYAGSWVVSHDDRNRVTSGTYAAIDASTCEVKEIQKSDTGFYWAGACVNDSYVVFGSNSNGTDDNAPSDGMAKLYCYDKSTGKTESCQVEGSVCSTVVESDGKFYFTTKAGKLYEASIADGRINAVSRINMGSPSTGNLIIRDGKIYAGCKNGVIEADLSDWSPKTYSAPSDVKHLTFVGDRLICTYYSGNGGLYDPVGEYDYFTPDAGMRGFCISDIAANGSTLYYKNDSGYIMCVETSDVNIINQTASYTYAGKPIVPNVEIMSKGKVLDEGEDYHIDASGLIGAGTREFTVTGAGEYSFSHTKKINIAKGANQIKCPNIIKKVYGASAFKLGASADGKLTYSSSVPSVAQVSADGLVTIKGIGKTVITIKAAETESYLPDTAKVTVTVVPKTVSGVKVYAGSRKMTVKWKKMTGITGYQITYSRSSKFSSGNKNVNVTRYSTVKKTIKKLTKKKYYYVKVRAYKTVSGTKYYGNYSTIKKVKIR